MPNDPTHLLRQHGLHITAQRLAVLQAIAGRPHSTADDVAGAGSQEIRRDFSPSGLRRPRHAGRGGIIRRIQPAGSPARYEDRVGDNHHHLICRTLRQDGRRRLRRRRHAVLDRRRRFGLPDRRSGGHLLGHVSRVSVGSDRRLSGKQLPVNVQYRMKLSRSVELTTRTRHGELTMSDDRSQVPDSRTPPLSRRRHHQPRLVAEPAASSNCCASTRRSPTRWARTSTTPKSSTASTSPR